MFSKTCDLLGDLMPALMSSPEIAPNGYHDYTMYVLDPLEVQPSAPSPVLGAPPVNVAIALGSMAQALQQQSDLDMTVRGIWKVDELTGESLEVVFALREVSFSHSCIVSKWQVVLTYCFKGYTTAPSAFLHPTA